MNNFNSMRRDFLRFGSYGIAAAAAFPLVAWSQQTAPSSSGVFDVRKYGATGDGKTSIPTASTAPSRRHQPPAVAWLSFLPGPISASPFT